MFPKTFLFILLTAMCMSCDPARILIIDSGKKQDSSITLYANKSIYPDYGQAVDYAIVHVPPIDSISQRVLRFHYGFGLWSPEEVSSFAAGIDSIVFNGSKQTESLHTFDDINAYLLKHRVGILNNTMKIKG